jgi:hypothetical protein
MYATIGELEIWSGAIVVPVAIRETASCKLAIENLIAAIPGIEVQTYFVDFEGVWATHAPAANEGPSDSREQERPQQFQAKASSSFC